MFLFSLIWKKVAGLYQTIYSTMFFEEFIMKFNHYLMEKQKSFKTTTSFNNVNNDTKVELDLRRVAVMAEKRN